MNVAEKYTAADIDEFLDREAIRDLLARYGHGIDRCDPEVLRSVYWPEGTDDHGFFNGKRDDFIAWVIAALRNNMTMTQHHMANPLIRIDGTTATSETNFVAYQRAGAEGAPGSEIVINGGRYLDRFEKRGKEWRIIARSVAYDYTEEYAADAWNMRQSKWGSPDVVIGARKDDGDPTAKLFGRTLSRVPFAGRA